MTDMRGRAGQQGGQERQQSCKCMPSTVCWLIALCRRRCKVLRPFGAPAQDTLDWHESQLTDLWGNSGQEAEAGAPAELQRDVDTQPLAFSMQAQRLAERQAAEQDRRAAQPAPGFLPVDRLAEFASRQPNAVG